MSSTPSKVSITLVRPEDWDEWMLIVNSMARNGNVKDLIDPNLPTEPPQPVEPRRPTAVDAGAASITALTADQQKVYALLRDDFKYDMMKYRDQREALKSIQDFILTRVDRQHLILLEGKETVYQMLVALKKRLAPTDRAREMDVIRRYRELQRAPKSQQIDKWLQQWERVYTEAQNLSLPDVQKERPLYDFLNALRPVDTAFVAGREATLEERIRRKEDLPTILDMLENYRNHVRISKASSTKGSSHAAFATFQGNSENDEKKKKSTKCVCGEEHLFKECPYLIESLRASSWTPDSEIQQKINEKLEKIPKLKAAAEKAQKQAKEQQKSKNKKEEKSTEKPATAMGAFAVESFSYKLKNCWTLDSGTDTHVCNDRTRFKFERMATEEDVLIAGKTTYAIEAFGRVEITVKTPTGPALIELLNVALAPGFMTNLVCLRRFTDKGVHWDTQKERLHRNGRTFCYTQSVDDHWVLEYGPPEPLEDSRSAFASNKPSRALRGPVEATANEWHEILGHPGPESIAHLEQSVDGARVTGRAPSTIECETCSLTKAHEMVSRRTDQEELASEPLSRVGYDLISMTTAYNGDKWVSHFYCLKTSMDFVYTHSKKNHALEVIKEFLEMAKTRYSATVRFIRTDGERTLGRDYDAVTKKNGITTERSAPYTPAQNGATERAGGVLTLRARALRIGARLPDELWPEAFKAAGYLNNRTPKRGLEWKTPFEAILKQRPQLSHLYPYGCRAYPLRKNIPRSHKLESRALIGYLVGYDSTNIYRIWIPSRGRVVRTRDVTFNKGQFYDPKELDSGHLLTTEIEDLIEVIEMPEPSYTASRTLVNDDIDDPEPPHLPDALGDEGEDPIDAVDSTHGVDDATQEEEIHHYPTPEITPERNSEKRITGAETSAHATRADEISASFDTQNILPSRTRGAKRREAYATTLAQPADLSAFHAAFAVGLNSSIKEQLHRDSLPPEPRSWKQMTKHRFANEFRNAAEKEIGELAKKGTYEVVLKDMQKEILPLTWVFKYKFNTDGYLEKFKARLCVRGDLQTTEQDTYAATLAARTLRALIAIAAAFDLDMMQYDAVNAFANSFLEDEIYCYCPEGFARVRYIWKLRRALYGLKQSPLLWYKHLTKALEELGLHSVPGVNCLYANEYLILFFYVDDVVLLSTKQNSDKRRAFEAALLRRFEMKSLGELKWFLGIRILRDRDERRIWLCQDSYICKIAAKFNLADSKGAPKTPLPADGVPPANNDEDSDPQRTHAFQSRIGSLNFAAVVTRPDIAFATSKLAQNLKNPSAAHIAVANRVIAYLYATRNYAIEYDGRATAQIFMASSDAAYADNESRHSSDGYLFQLYGGAIDWRAAKQRTVTTSSTEAELLALSRAAKEIIWWRRFFASIRFDTQQEMVINCDNLQTIRLLEQDVLKLDTKLRHIDIHQHWLRQEVQAKRVLVRWLPTADMPADGMTKQLTRQKQERFVKQLNLVDISEKLSITPIRKSNELQAQQGAS